MRNSFGQYLCTQRTCTYNERWFETESFISKQAIQHHQKALTVSLQLKNKLMQSVAMGNIGYVGQLQGEYQTVSR